MLCYQAPFQIASEADRCIDQCREVPVNAAYEEWKRAETTATAADTEEADPTEWVCLHHRGIHGVCRLKRHPALLNRAGRAEKIHTSTESQAWYMCRMYAAVLRLCPLLLYAQSAALFM